MIGLPLALLAVLTGSLTGYVLADPRQAWRDVAAFLAFTAALLTAGARAVRRELAGVARRWTA